MLRSLGQSWCVCRCALLNGWTHVGASAQTRSYQNPSTIVLERRYPVNLVGEGKYPKLKHRHNVLKVVDHEPNKYNNKIKCILTETVNDLGIKGSLVEVKKRLFRNVLYPKGQAIYASPENLELYAESIAELQNIDQDLMAVMDQLAGCHLRIFMHKTNEWTIRKDHIRIAFRQASVMVADDNIILPEKEVTDFSTFVFQVQVANMLRTKCKATVYPIIGPDDEYPVFKAPIFGNAQVDKSSRVEYIGNKGKTPVNTS